MVYANQTISAPKQAVLSGRSFKINIRHSANPPTLALLTAPLNPTLPPPLPYLFVSPKMTLKSFLPASLAPQDLVALMQLILPTGSSASAWNPKTFATKWLPGPIGLPTLPPPPPWAAYRAIMANRLVALDKEPGTRPVGIGKIYRRLWAKCLLKAIGSQASNSSLWQP